VVELNDDGTQKYPAQTKSSIYARRNRQVLSSPDGKEIPPSLEHQTERNRLLDSSTPPTRPPKRRRANREIIASSPSERVKVIKSRDHPEEHTFTPCADPQKEKRSEAKDKVTPSELITELQSCIPPRSPSPSATPTSSKKFKALFLQPIYQAEPESLSQHRIRISRGFGIVPQPAPRQRCLSTFPQPSFAALTRRDPSSIGETSMEKKMTKKTGAPSKKLSVPQVVNFDCSPRIGRLSMIEATSRSSIQSSQRVTSTARSQF
jgi:hypothetical protein